MNKRDLFAEIVTTYRKHGWQVRCALLKSETRTELLATGDDLAECEMKEGLVDALWFSRPSHNGREAWELRLLAETPYALFETFDAADTEEQRDDVRREMEARLRDYVLRPSSGN